MSSFDRFCRGRRPNGYVCDPFSGYWVSGRDKDELRYKIEDKLDSYEGAKDKSWSDGYNNAKLLLDPETGRWRNASSPNSRIYQEGQYKDDLISRRELENALIQILGPEFYYYDIKRYYPSRRYISRDDLYIIESREGTMGRPINIIGPTIGVSTNSGDSLEKSATKKQSILERFKTQGPMLPNETCNKNTLEGSFDESSCIVSHEKINPNLPEGFINVDNFSKYGYMKANLANGSTVNLIIREISYNPEKEGRAVQAEVAFANFMSQQGIGPELLCTFNFKGMGETSSQILVFKLNDTRLTEYVIQNADNKAALKDILDKTGTIVSDLILQMGFSCYIFSPNFFMFDPKTEKPRLFDIGTTYCMTDAMTDIEKTLIYYLCMCEISVSLQQKMAKMGKSKYINNIKEVFTELFRDSNIFVDPETGEERHGYGALNEVKKGFRQLFREYPHMIKGYRVFGYGSIDALLNKAFHTNNPKPKESALTSSPGIASLGSGGLYSSKSRPW